MRWVRIGETEVLRGIYLSVRDKDWRNPESVVSRIRFTAAPRSFEARFIARQRLEGVDVRWLGSVIGSDLGELTFSGYGRAYADSLASRIGFCVLHPTTIAGAMFDVRTAEGSRIVQLPRRITAGPLITDIVGLRWALPGLAGQAILDFEGDRFEMEDQRNWTDASFKTYSRPLRLPFPFAVRHGATFTQTVRLRFENVSEPGRRRRSRSAVVRIEVTGQTGRPLPPIGYGITIPAGAPRPSQIELLRALRPAHLRLVLDLSDPVWPDAIAQSGETAHALGAGLELEVVAARNDDVSFGQLAAVVARARPRVTSVFPFDAGSSISTSPVIRGVREAFEAANVPVRFGGGSRTDFADVNRSRLPSEAMDVAGYPISPQVHAVDEASMLETLAIQAETVLCVRRSLRGLPVFVGPVTLKPRALNLHGPWGGAVTAPPDPRQGSVFAACWTVGSIRALTGAGVASLTYFELIGPAGILPTDPTRGGATTRLDRPGVFPLYHVFADLAERPWHLLRVVAPADSGLQVIALAWGDTRRLLIANTSDQQVAVEVVQPSVSTVWVRTLSKGTATDAVHRPEAFRLARERLTTRSGRIRLDLGAMTITRVDS